LGAIQIFLEKTGYSLTAFFGGNKRKVLTFPTKINGEFIKEGG